MKKTTVRITSATIALAVATTFGLAGVASAANRVAAPSTTTSTTEPGTAGLQTIIADLKAKITKRQTDLAALATKINASTKLTAANKTALLAEVAAAQKGINDLKAKVDTVTTVKEAKAIRTSLVQDFRVYLLVIPKVHMLQAADAQQAKQAKMLEFAALLRTKAEASSSSATLLPKIDEMVAKVTAAQVLSKSIQGTVAGLKPTDYNANHNVLKKAQADLKSARELNKAAFKIGVEVRKALKPVTTTTPTP